MQRVKLGKTGLECAKLGYGCMSLSSNIYTTEKDYTDEHGIAVIRAAIDAGVTHFDTAIVYGNGHNETLLGKAIEGYCPREKLQIATKTGIDFSSGAVQINGKPGFIRRTCDDSLKRLNLDYIDVFYLHRIDTSTPIKETIAEMRKLVEEGKIRHIGLSEASAKTIRDANQVHPISVVQLEWSLWSRDVEEHVIPACRELGIGIVPYSPLGRGILTGSIKSSNQFETGDRRSTLPRFQGENMKTNLGFVEKVSAMAKAKGCTPGQLSLAWVLTQGEDVSPIPGTSKVPHLLENMRALDVKLSPEEVLQLQQLVPPDQVAGDRYQAGIPTFKDN